MSKLSEYVETASSEYLRETGSSVLDARWIAEFYQDSGLLDEYPRQDLVAFAEMVQKALTRQIAAAQRKRLSPGNIIRFLGKRRP